MNTICFFGRLTGDAFRRACRRPWILLGLSLLCLLMTLGTGAAAAQTLSRGVSLSPLTLAIEQEPGDSLPALLERQIGNMKDVSRYCRIVAMARPEAEEALKTGEIDALVCLPDGFVQGVMDGSNPDVELLVSGKEPLEALLTLWVGQSAVDLLSAVQSGIYGVLDQYRLHPVDGHTWDQVITEINLKYIARTLNRQRLFRVDTLSPTGVLPTAMHYGLSLTAFFALSGAPMALSLFGPGPLQSRRRLRALGYRDGFLFAADLLGAVWAAFLWLLPPAAVLCRSLWAGLMGAAAMALFCGLFGCLCSLLTGSAAACSVLSFLLSLGFLVVSGGIVPPVLLPEPLRLLAPCSPITWLRTAAAWMKIPGDRLHLLLLGLTALLMIPAAGWLYHKKLDDRRDDL